MTDARQRYLDFGEFRLDTFERALTRNGETIPLTLKSYHLLVTFLHNSGHLLTHEELMRSVWYETTVDRSSLKQTVANLRKTLGDVHEKPCYIQTVARFGYRFIADVTTRSDERLVMVAERRSLSVMDIEETIVDEDRRPQPVFMALKKILFTAAIVLMFVGGFSFWNYDVRSASKPDFLTYDWHALAADDKEAVNAIAPNGEFIIFLQQAERQETLKMRRLAGDESITIVQDIHVPIWGLAISHDNNYVYYILAERSSQPTAGTLYRVSVLGGQPRKVVEGINGGPTLSPDDRRVAFIRNSAANISQLLTANANDGSDEQIVSSSDQQPQLWNPSWSPNGKKIVCFTREKRDDENYYSLVEVPASGGSITKITEPSNRYIWWHYWMHDGSGLLAVRSDDATNIRQLVFISYPDGSISKISHDLNQYSAPSVSDDGSKIVTNRYSRQSDLIISDEKLTSDNSLRLLGCCSDTVSWLSDEKIIFDAFQDGKRSLWTSSVDGSNQTKLFASDSQDWSPNASADGTSIVFVSMRSGTKQIWKCASDGSGLVQLTNAAYDVDSPHFSKDGQFIYFSQLSENKWKIARMPADGGESDVVVNENASIWDVSPNGKRIAYISWPEGADQDNMLIADTQTKQVTARFNIPSRSLLRWSPDGHELIFEQPDPNEPSLHILKRINVDDPSTSLPVIKTPLVTYFLEISPNGRKYAFIRGHISSSPAMLVRK